MQGTTGRHNLYSIGIRLALLALWSLVQVLEKQHPLKARKGQLGEERDVTIVVSKSCGVK